MTKELFVALEIAHAELGRQLDKMLREVAGVKLQSWPDSLGEKGPSAVKTVPDIIIIDDAPASGDLYTRIKNIKDNFHDVTLLVISSNMDPQHIINAMKAGAAEYLVEPVDQKAVLNAIEEVRAKLANLGKIAKGKIYSFISAKGGVGSTVLSVNTAAAMAIGRKSSVALFDMCFQSGDASVLLDIVPQTTMIDLSRNIHRLDVSFLRSAMYSHATGINFLSAPLNPEDSEEIKSDHIRDILILAKKLYDNVVIDCPSMQINDCTVAAFKESDKIFIVTDMSVPSIRNTMRFYKLMVKVGIGQDKFEIIINRFIKGGAISLSEIEKNFLKPVYWLVSNDFSDIVSSINQGIPLIKLSQSAPFSKNVELFTKKIQGTLEDREFRGIRGTFGKAI